MIHPQELRIGNLLNHSELGIVEVIVVGNGSIATFLCLDIISVRFSAS